MLNEPSPSTAATSSPSPAATPPSATDVAVVGGGVAGLIAANAAADTGGDVTLVERRRLGGRAQTDTRDGYRLNRGPHALYRSGELAGALARLGIEVRGTNVDGGAWFGVRNGVRSPLPVGLTSLLGSRLLSGGSKARLGLLMRRLARTDPGTLATTTVDDWVADLAGPPDLRLLTHALVRLATYNSASDLASADAAAMQLQRSIDDGVMYVDDGWAQLVDGLRERAARAGVRFVEATVEHVEPGERPMLRLGGGGSMTAGAVVVAAGSPDTTDALLDTGSSLRAAAGPDVTAAALDLGLTAEPPAAVLLGIDEPLYLSVHSIAAVAPAGRSLAIAAKYIHPHDETGPDDTRARLRRHAELAGIRDDDIEMTRYLHRMTVTGGMPLAARGGLAGRPDVHFGGGVWIAGDWVGPDGLLADASAASALRAGTDAARHAASTRAAA